MTNGRIISYDQDEETGYIDPDDGEERIPFDEKSLKGFRRGVYPQPGDRVSFVVEGGLAGIWAIEVKLLE